VLSCREVVELVTDLLENALAPARRADMIDHLRECGDCLRYVAQLQITGRLLADLPVERLTPSERDTLLGAYRLWRAAQPEASASGGHPAGA